jgi:phosphate-selective porin
VRRPRVFFATSALVLTLAPDVSAQGWTAGPGLALRNDAAGAELRLTGYGQLDLRSFRNWSDPSEPPLEDGVFVERARLGLEGQWRKVSFEVQGDLRDDERPLKDAWVSVRFARELRLRVGSQKVPIGREWLTSSRRTDFLSRALLAEHLGPSRDFGAALFGDLGKVEYEAGVFLGDGWRQNDRAETTVAGRLVLAAGGGLQLGASFSAGDVEAMAGTADLQPRGPEGEALSTFEFFPRKFVNGRRRRLGADAAFLRGPVSLKAEYLERREERLGQGATREDLPGVVGRGWSASGTWLLTGEKKKAGIEPQRPLPRGPGAVELALRYEELRYDDDGPDTGLAGVGNRSRNLRPAGDRAFSGGLSWWPVSIVRLAGNVIAERFRDPLLAPEPGRAGTYLTLAVRLQVELP